MIKQKIKIISVEVRLNLEDAKNVLPYFFGAPFFVKWVSSSEGIIRYDYGSTYKEHSIKDVARLISIIDLAHALNVYDQVKEIIYETPSSAKSVAKFGFDFSANHLATENQDILLTYLRTNIPSFLVPTLHSGVVELSYSEMSECVLLHKNKMVKE